MDVLVQVDDDQFVTVRNAAGHERLARALAFVAVWGPARGIERSEAHKIDDATIEARTRIVPSIDVDLREIW